ncbi:MAG: SPFH domain-containing protein [Coriobacteriia bacterium]|nr:SPFH domain-containing protein [Coriobacteriia bacterium]
MSSTSKERVIRLSTGWGMLAFVIVLFIVSTVLLVVGAVFAKQERSSLLVGSTLVAGTLLCTLACFLSPGFFTLQPNVARVLILFGSYRGTVREAGFWWGNPFYDNGLNTLGLEVATGSAQTLGSKTRLHAGGKHTSHSNRLGRYKVSLRARTLNMDPLKVNDERGNPVEIGAVVVWSVADTAQAVFDVDDYEVYVATQSETALRHIATQYAYDHGEDEAAEGEITLRSNVEEVSEALKSELAERLSKAGVIIEDARLTHLAYAPEIAQAMLRRQQAEAIIAARRKIVTGAVGMVEMALEDLTEKHVVDLDAERTATMVSNLMVVLCGEAEVHPVVNAGSLY